MTDERNEELERAERERHRRSNRGVRWIVFGIVALTVVLVLGGGIGVLTNLSLVESLTNLADLQAIWLEVKQKGIKLGASE